jgi:hypothetical protein
MARTKDPSGIDKVPFVERKFEGAAWRCVLGKSVCGWYISSRTHEYNVLRSDRSTIGHPVT